ncbi:MAG: hypothetical protein L0Y70_25105 [Gemmataceae bacterium]|nr:hypothetical protein [Gemmataceae bacterium]
MTITDELTINGLGENYLTISGNDATRVFSISGSTTDVEITGLTIADGSATGTTMTAPWAPSPWAAASSITAATSTSSTSP